MYTEVHEPKQRLIDSYKPLIEVLSESECLKEKIQILSKIEGPHRNTRTVHTHCTCTLCCYALVKSPSPSHLQLYVHVHRSIGFCPH